MILLGVNCKNNSQEMMTTCDVVISLAFYCIESFVKYHSKATFVLVYVLPKRISSFITKDEMQ